MRSAVRLGLVLLFLSCIFAGLHAQTGSSALRGEVTDPSGAVLPGAQITAIAGNGRATTTTSDSKGVYELKGLAPGTYAVHVTAKGFAASDFQDLILPVGATQLLDIALVISVDNQQVEVQEESTAVSLDPSSSASSTVIKGSDLDALSDDPDELQSDLQALAGPATGPNGGEIYIDGFDGGSLPPKSAIREIRVNQNPFSAQYEHPGFGRIEVLTKPGQDKFHGQFQINVNHSLFNSMNPFLRAGTKVPDYHSEIYNGNFGGPLNKKSSFFVDFQRRNINEVSTINANVPCAEYVTTGACSSFAWQPFTAAVPSPGVHYEFSPRIDYQLTPNNTLTVGYQYENASNQNGGVGQYNLPSRAYNRNSDEHNIRISDTQVINPTMINETRLRFVREHYERNGILAMPAVSVQDEFSGGGNTGGISSNNLNRIALQNYTSKVYGNHMVRFGGRVRVNNQNDYSLSNPYGLFLYQSRLAYEAGTPMQFTITAGSPRAELTQTDAGLYAEDDWRVKPNVTLSYGLRFETQSNVNNKANFAPRLGVAWGIGGGKSPKTVLRTGFGIFYDRFDMGGVMNVRRTNYADKSMNQVNYLVESPTFNTVPADLSGLAFVRPIVYAIDPDLKLPYIMQVAVTLERQISKSATVTASYIGTRGLHQSMMENLEGPNAYTREYRSDGTFKQQQFMSNTNVRMGRHFSLFGWYTLSFADSNTSGGYPTFPSDLAFDWGRASFDVRHRGMIGGSINLPYDIRLNPFIQVRSGRPYNLSAGTDLNGDTDTGNDRPWFSNRCAGIPTGEFSNGIYNTSLGCYSVDPTSPGNIARVPVNYLTGPGSFTTNLRVSKAFNLGGKVEQASGQPGAGPQGGGRRGGRGGFGPRAGNGQNGGARSRYNLMLGVSVRNLFNHVNRATPTGNLSSDNFGKSVSLADSGFFSGSANRRVDFQVTFNF